MVWFEIPGLRPPASVAELEPEGAPGEQQPVSLTEQRVQDAMRPALNDRPSFPAFDPGFGHEHQLLLQDEGLWDFEVPCDGVSYGVPLPALCRSLYIQSLTTVSFVLSFDTLRSYTIPAGWNGILWVPPSTRFTVKSASAAAGSVVIYASRLRLAPTGTALGAAGGATSVNATIVGPLDGAGNVKVDLSTALPAGANAIGAVSVTNLPASQAVTAADGALVTIGAEADAAVTTAVAGTLMGYLRALKEALLARIPVLGQALKAASLPVTLASDQGTLAISAAALPLPAGAATSANQPAPGQAVKASSLPVTIASDQGTIGVTIGAANSATAQVTASATVSTTLAVARPTRKRVTIKNIDAANTGFVAETTASSVKMPLKPGESIVYESQLLYAGIGDGTHTIVFAVTDEFN